MTAAPITIRIPSDLLAKLPPPSLTGERSAFILAAIREKLEKNDD
jgi:metal-responsive CopG/Arc/MetJ family transcriptional regulator